MREAIVVLDFGAQYSQLIARRVRELNVYCEVLPYHADPKKLSTLNVKGYILSGGPDSVYATNAPQLPRFVLDTQRPVLGICYGMQLLAHHLGGNVVPGHQQEYGSVEITPTPIDNPLFDTHAPQSVWMSHGDRVTQLPPGFETLAASKNSPHASVGDMSRHIYGLQYHPEVTHTPQGKQLLHNFLYKVCGCQGGWTTGNFVDEAIEAIRQQVGSSRVVCGLSGGVDSSVVAALLHQAIGDQLTCIFVNTGMMRLNEPEQVVQTFQTEMHAQLVAVDATETFLSALNGVTNPETKRKIIGEKFVRIFEAEARKLGQVDFLAQGTLYPDVIESASRDQQATAATIKTHHNVGGLPEDMDFELVEPLRYLFKDEVRALGEALALPADIVWRHPFPGPGLAVRILGEITWERLETLRAADAIFIEELWNSGWYHKTSQAFAVLLPVKTVGVMGDGRTYADAIALRAVTTDDFMTADWTRLPTDLLAHVSNRIVNEVGQVNRVVYDVSSKPPATIEWE